MLRVWLKYVESIRGEEETVHICEPETGKSLNYGEEKRSEKGVRNCPVSNEGLLGFLEGNKNRSMVDLKDCQVGSEKFSYCQVGNEMGSLEDLIEYQEGRETIPYFQVGKGENMNSVESSYH
jgi:hypothetical protein